MKQWSFIFWSLVSISVVAGAFILNMNGIQASERSLEVLAANTTAESNNTSGYKQKRNTRLDSLAQKRANDMSTREYYAHETPDGRYFHDYFENIGIPTETPSCENLLLMPSGLSKDAVFDHWEQSPDHKRCLDAAHTSYGYAETVFDDELKLSVYVYIAATLQR